MSDPVDSPQPVDALEGRVRQALNPGLQLVRPVGEGGMGSVFLARDPALKRLVAVKVLAPHLASDPAARTRFEREAQAVAGLAHPNVVAVHGVGELGDHTPYFVMQYVAGRSMAARLEADGPLDPDEARRIMGEVASALAAAHAKGIIHRDIKPANILYDEDTGRVLVSDFGIAAIRSAGARTAEVRLTQTGMALGTPQYMSPEQLLAEPVTERTDVYALGLLGYELLAGAGPFLATTPQELIAMHLRDAPPRLTARRPDVDAELDDLIQACLAKDPAKRPAAADVARRLAPGAGIPLEWPPPGLEPLRGALRKVTRQFWLGSAALAAALLGFVGFGTGLPPGVGAVVLAVLAVLGTVAVGVALRGLLAAGRVVRLALDLGYTWLTVAEVAADARGDSGALLVGAREYAGLDATSRSDLRRGRIMAMGLSLGGAALPVLLLLVTAWLGASGVLSEQLVPVVVLFPPAAALGGAMLIRERERRAVGPARRQLAQRRRRGSTVPRLVEPWYAAYDSVTSGQTLGRGRGGRRRLGRWAPVVWAAATTVTVVALFPLWLVGVLGPMLASSVAPRIESTVAKVRIANLFRGLAPPVDAAITPRRAGAAFWALQNRGAGPSPAAGPFRQLPAERLTDIPHLDRSNDQRFAGRTSNAWPGPGLLAGYSRQGYGVIGPLSAAERAYLAELTASPVWTAFGTVARAPGMDYLGARFALPFPEHASFADLPIPRFAGTKELAYAQSARAAWLVSQGRPADAERALKETLGFGYRMMDGTSLIETLIGVVVVGIGRGELMEFYIMTHRPEGLRMRALTDSINATLGSGSGPVPAASDDGGAPPSFDPEVMRRRAIAASRDTSLPRGVRFTELVALGVLPCTNAREMVFGPAADIRRAFEDARRSLARSAADSALLDLVYHAPERGFRSVVPDALAPRTSIALARAAGFLLANPRLRGCVELIWASQLMQTVS